MNPIRLAAWGLPFALLAADPAAKLLSPLAPAEAADSPSAAAPG